MTTTQPAQARPELWVPARPCPPRSTGLGAPLAGGCRGYGRMSLLDGGGRSGRPSTDTRACLCGGSWTAAGRAGWTERGRLCGGQRRASEASGREDGGNSSQAMLAAGACCYTAPMTSEAPARPQARRKLQLPGERGWGGAQGWMGCWSPGRDFPTVRGAGCSGLGAQWGLQGRDPCAGARRRGSRAAVGPEAARAAGQA